MPTNRILMAIALAGTLALGTLAGATIPTHMKSTGAETKLPSGPSLDGRDYYVEPAPQDLAPIRSALPWDAYQPGAAVEARASSADPYAYTYTEDAYRDEALPEIVTYEPAADEAAISAEEQAAEAAQVAAAVHAAEQAPAATAM